jgi:hypothetical protein
MKLRAIFALASAALMTLVFALVSGAGITVCNDGDTDGVCDPHDSCLSIPNPAQIDANLDGYGNICDWDIDDSGAGGGGDIAQIIANWLASAPHPADTDESGAVGGGDVAWVIAHWLFPPGPSGRSCATSPSGTGACPPTNP